MLTAPKTAAEREFVRFVTTEAGSYDRADGTRRTQGYDTVFHLQDWAASERRRAQNSRKAQYAQLAATFDKYATVNISSINLAQDKVPVEASGVTPEKQRAVLKALSIGEFRDAIVRHRKSLGLKTNVRKVPYEAATANDLEFVSLRGKQKKNLPVKARESIVKKDQAKRAAAEAKRTRAARRGAASEARRRRTRKPQGLR